jgi:hypothetical protein
VDASFRAFVHIIFRHLDRSQFQPLKADKKGKDRGVAGEDSMPIVLRIGGYRFGFFASDRSEPPHIHVRRGRKKVKFWLVPEVRLARNERFAQHELNELRRTVIAHRAYIIEKWHEFFDE